MDYVHVAGVPPELLRPLSPVGKARLAGEVLLAYCRVRLQLWRRDLPTAVASLRGEASGHDDSHVSNSVHVQAARLSWAVQKTLRLVPTDSRCLMRSLVLTSLLAKRHIPSTLVIGVRAGTDFEAHAWVRYGESTLLPGDQGCYSTITEL